MPERKFPYFALTASFLAMLGLIVLTVMELVGYAELSAVESLETSTVEEIVGIYNSLVFFAMFYPIIALCGLATSWYCGVNTTTLWVRRASFIMLGVCVAVLFPFVASLIGWTDPAWIILQIAKWFANLFV